MDFDLESLVNLEQSFYDEGYRDGFAHGQIHGLIEGRALGREKGYELFEELGFYEGFALTWKKILHDKPKDRAMHHIRHLLELISQFPRVNPTPANLGEGAEELDIQKLFQQIRSRYKALCATLGVPSSLRAVDSLAEDDTSPIAEEGSTAAVNPQKQKVWTLDNIEKRSTREQLSF